MRPCLTHRRRARHAPDSGTHHPAAPAPASPHPRWRARWLVIAAAAALLGCASNPYIFSPKLDTFDATAHGTASPDKALVGDLQLALAALMHQRRLLWEAAGDTETMKNATALGLIGLGTVGLYKGIETELNRRWLTKAGLLGAGVYAGASWLEPSARQKSISLAP